MTEWKVYDGSDVDVSNIEGSQYGFIVKYSDSSVSDIFTSILDGIIRNSPDITHYLICNPNPWADMAYHQMRTGQSVYVRVPCEPMIIPQQHVKAGDLLIRVTSKDYTYVTDKPDWHIPGAEYSFTAFGEEA